MESHHCNIYCRSNIFLDLTTFCIVVRLCFRFWFPSSLTWLSSGFDQCLCGLQRLTRAVCDCFISHSVGFGRQLKWIALQPAIVLWKLPLFATFNMLDRFQSCSFSSLTGVFLGVNSSFLECQLQSTLCWSCGGVRVRLKSESCTFQDLRRICSRYCYGIRVYLL